MNLAYVGQIIELLDIPKADRIVEAVVNCGDGGSWHGVVQKGLYDIGTKVTVYLQDAVVQPSEELSFLAKTNYRVKMQRLRGVPSECVMVPCTLDLAVGTDVSELLGVTKYEKEGQTPYGGSNWPSFLIKTDEPNFQRSGKLINALMGKRYYATEKADGMSSTAYRYKGHFGVCSRNFELKEGDSKHWIVAKNFLLDLKLPEGFAIQWETVGPGIQGNPLGLVQLEARAFNVYNIEEKRYLDRVEFVSFCDNLAVPTAPVIHAGIFSEGFDLRKMAEGKYPNGVQREGLVFRPYVEEWVGQSRLSFKVINLLYKD